MFGNRKKKQQELCLAIRHGDLDAVKDYLSQKNADLDFKSQEGNRHPFALAAVEGQAVILDRLLCHHDHGYTPKEVCLAIMNDLSDVLYTDTMLVIGNFYNKNRHEENDDYRESVGAIIDCLMKRDGPQPLAAFLRGADLYDIRDYRERPLLQIFVDANELDWIPELVSGEGKRLVEQDTDGRVFAEIMHHHNVSVDAVKAMVEAGSDIYRFAMGGTALYHAAKYCNADVIEYLIDQDAEGDFEKIQGKNRDSFFLKMVKRGSQIDNKVFYKAIKKYGAPLHEDAVVYETVAHSVKGNTMLLSLLVREGFDINKPDSENQRTPLLRALHSDDLCKALFLIEKGADPFLPDKNGESAALFIRKRLEGGHDMDEVLSALSKAGVEIEKPDTGWALTNDGDVVHERDIKTPGDKFRLTEIFNFDRRERISVLKSYNKEGISHNQTPFAEIEDSVLQAAWKNKCALTGETAEMPPSMSLSTRSVKNVGQKQKTRLPKR